MPDGRLGAPTAGRRYLIVTGKPRRSDARSGQRARQRSRPASGGCKVSALVAAVSVLGLLVTVTLLPEPKGASLEQLTILPGQPGAAVTGWFERYLQWLAGGQAPSAPRLTAVPHR
jgi:hypothetical protein